MRNLKAPLAFVASAAAVLAIGGAPSALALSSGNRTITVSCTGEQADTSYGITLTHSSKGAISFTQKGTSPKSSTNVTMVSKPSLKMTGWQTVGDGNTAKWDSVLAGTYFPRVFRSGEKNCNDSRPGNGTYDLTYNFSTRG